jgi:hypothetical protein
MPVDAVINSSMWTLVCQRGQIIWQSTILKAAPRFELGVKVLQTSALPLGYAATPTLYSFSSYCLIA